MDIITANWNELPKELLELIFKRLQYVQDILRFGAVCRPWRLVASEVKQLFKPSSPILLLPPDNNNEAYRLFNLSKNKAVEIQLEGAYGAWCCNSWNGWLVTINYTPPYAINFLDPIRGVQIPLPPAMAFEHPPPEICQTPLEVFIWRAIASSAPSDPNCVFMAICCNWRELAFCKPGDKGWTALKTRAYYKDIIYYKDNFYAVGFYGLVQCEIGEEPKVIPFAPRVKREVIEHAYLVESSGDLLQIIREVEWEDGDVARPYRYYTSTFEVFKLDFSTKTWNQVNDLGGNALFLGHNRSISISTKDFSDFKQDCIYYLDNYFEGYFENPRGCHDMGVFNVKTQFLEPIFQSNQIWTSPLFWVTL